MSVSGMGQLVFTQILSALPFKSFAYKVMSLPKGRNSAFRMTLVGWSFSSFLNVITSAWLLPSCMSNWILTSCQPHRVIFAS